MTCRCSLNHRKIVKNSVSIARYSKLRWLWLLQAHIILGQSFWLLRLPWLIKLLLWAYVNWFKRESIILKVKPFLCYLIISIGLLYFHIFVFLLRCMQQPLWNFFKPFQFFVCETSFHSHISWLNKYFSYNSVRGRSLNLELNPCVPKIVTGPRKYNQTPYLNWYCLNYQIRLNLVEVLFLNSSSPYFLWTYYAINKYNHRT